MRGPYVALGGLVVGVLGLLAFAASTVLTHHTPTSDYEFHGVAAGEAVTGHDPAPPPSAAEQTQVCATLAQDAVKGSASAAMANGGTLIKIRSPRMVEDLRNHHAMPTGNREVLVMRCAGTGVWTDGTVAPIAYRATEDSDGTYFVRVAPQG